MALNGKKALGASKTYTDESLLGLGALKGSPATVKGYREDADGNTIVVFAWEDKNGVEHTEDAKVRKGVSVKNIVINDGKFVLALSDGTITDEVELPTQDIGIQVLYEGQPETDIKDNAEFIVDENEDAFDYTDLHLVTESELNTKLAQLSLRFMESLIYANKKLTIKYRNGNTEVIDVSNIITDTNIDEFKDMLVTNVLDGQSLVWNASKKKWVNKSIDSSGMLVEAKKYTDDEIAKFNNKGSMAVDEKPTYYGGVITYKKGGETKTTEETGTWFYYYDDNHLAVQTIFIEGTEFTIAMAGDINLDDYVAKLDLIDVVDENFIEKTKIPTTKYIEELKGIIDDEIAEKINTSDIVDELNSDATDKPLSAKQGKELKSQIDALIDDDADKTVEDKTYSAKKIAEAIDGVNPSWNGTKAEFEALDKSTLKDGQTVNITDDWKSTDFVKIGENADGFYRKWENGILEQWGHLGQIFNSYQSGKKTLPMPFISNDYVVILNNGNTQNMYEPGISAQSNDSFDYFNLVNANGLASYYAIGKWK